HPEVPNTTIKLLLFPFSLEGEARTWLDKEPPHSILTWEDLVSKFINQFFPPSKTTYLRNEITNFLQKPNKTFNEEWEHFKDLLRKCPHHGFSELHQLDTFYNALNPNDQDALDSTAGGNFLDKIPRECFFSRRQLDIRMSRIEKFLNDMKASFVTPTAPIKAVEEVCVTCGANHSYNHCPLTRGNEFPVFHDNIQQFQTAAVEEIENFLNDDSIPIEVENSEFNMEEDILFLEGLLNEDPSPPPTMNPNQTKPSIKEPENSFSMGYEHFSTTLVTNKVIESSTKNLVPIPRECEVTSDNGKIDIVINTDDVLPPRVENGDSDGEVDVVDDLRVDNSISNSEHDSSESEESDFNNPLVPLPPLEPPDEELDFEIDFGDEILVVRNTIVDFKCIDARVKFDDKNDDYSYFMFDKVFSFLFAESEDMIFDPGFTPQ
nr:reverse transcriptase domain-containing protein [Tanacetum cinerariifolium]